MKLKTSNFSNYVVLLLIYEIVIILVSAIIVLLSFLDLFLNFPASTTGMIDTVDLVVCGIFALDLCLRLIFVKDKRKCMKESLFTVIAVVPFSSVFRIAGVFRIGEVLSILKISSTGGSFFSRFWLFIMKPAVIRFSKFFNLARAYIKKGFMTDHERVPK